MRRFALRPEKLLPWLTVFGTVCYVVSWLGREDFYESFYLTSEMVGGGYPDLLIPAAVAGAVLLVVLLAFVAMVLPFFIRVSLGAARLQLLAGGSIFLLSAVALQVTGASAGRNLLALPAMFGMLLGAHGFYALTGAVVTSSRQRRSRHIRRARRLRRRVKGKPADQAHDVILKYMRSRRRRRSWRPRLLNDLREALPTVFVLATVILSLLFLILTLYLSNAAKHAARDVLAGRPMFENEGDWPALFLLNVQARPVRVVAATPQFRHLEQATLLYLGRSGGAYVLYDLGTKKALLIPSGGIALEFGGST